MNTSLNTGIDEKLPPFSHEAVVAELAADADADLATFQSFGHSGFVAGIGFENGDAGVRTELCGEPWMDCGRYRWSSQLDTWPRGKR